MEKKGFIFLLMAFVLIGSSYCQENKEHKEKKYEVVKSEEEWKQILTEDEYNVLREKGTEYAFTGEYNDFKKKGVFVCAACGNELFSSKTKYNSGSGWPSFYKPFNENAIDEVPDNSMGMQRTEVVCARCGGHLGHVFEDGPQPTGLRYCVNSVAMDFQSK